MADVSCSRTDKTFTEGHCETIDNKTALQKCSEHYVKDTKWVMHTEAHKTTEDDEKKQNKKNLRSFLTTLDEIEGPFLSSYHKILFWDLVKILREKD